MTDEARHQEIENWMTEHYVCPECKAVDTMFQEYEEKIMLNPTTGESYCADGEAIDYFQCGECSYSAEEEFETVE